MTEKTIEIDIPILLPEIEDEEDECLFRLQDSLRDRRGILHSHLEREQTPPRLCVHFDPNLLSLARVERLVHEAGATLTNRYRHARIAFAGMDTADEARSLRRALERLPGMLHAGVNYAAGLAFVAYDTQVLDPEQIAQSMTGLGIRPLDWSPESDETEDERDHGNAPDFLPHWVQERWPMLLVVVAGLFLAAGWLGETVFGLTETVVVILFLLSYLAGGYDIASHALPGLLKGKFDTDVLMLAAATGAAVLGEWAEGAFLLFLFSLGHAGEHYALDRARNAVNALGQLMPKTARVKTDGTVLERPVGNLQIGEIVLVRPGDRIPVDGRILQGDSSVDQSPITGESVPVTKGPDDEVFAGTINQDAALEVEVTQLARDNTLTRVMRLVAEAQSQQSGAQRFAERFTARFVPAVLVLVLLVVAVPPLVGWMPLDESFYRAMLLLVAASPCALALGAPASVLAGIAQAARNGVLIKGGVHLEALGGLKAIAFDKTGTLTEGQFALTNIHPLNETTPERLLQVAAAVEQASNHPIAQAVVQAAQEQGLDYPLGEDLINVPGRGVQGRLNGQRVLIGSLKLFRETAKHALDPEVQDLVKGLEADGRTTMIVSLGGEYLGVLGLADRARPGVRETLSALRRAGVDHLVMLTGDNRPVAERIGKEVGVTDIMADLLPAQKLEAIKELQVKHGLVAMVGDGVNDAPALATASVGIAMGGAGTAVALETADVALMADDLGKLPFAVGLSRASRAIIRQNLAIALGVIGLLLVTSVFGWLQLSWAVVLHEGSSIVVVLNALRLLGYRQG